MLSISPLASALVLSGCGSDGLPGRASDGLTSPIKTEFRSGPSSGSPTLFSAQSTNLSSASDPLSRYGAICIVDTFGGDVPAVQTFEKDLGAYHAGPDLHGYHVAGVMHFGAIPGEGQKPIIKLFDSEEAANRPGAINPTEALRRARAFGHCRVTNLSFQMTGVSASGTEADFSSSELPRGVLVAAAGNKPRMVATWCDEDENSRTKIHDPEVRRRAVVVGGHRVNSDGTLSRLGSAATTSCSDMFVSAPYDARVPGTSRVLSGTSFAAPRVAAIVYAIQNVWGLDAAQARSFFFQHFVEPVSETSIALVPGETDPRAERIRWGRGILKDQDDIWSLNPRALSLSSERLSVSNEKFEELWSGAGASSDLSVKTLGAATGEGDAKPVDLVRMGLPGAVRSIAVPVVYLPFTSDGTPLGAPVPAVRLHERAFVDPFDEDGTLKRQIQLGSRSPGPLMAGFSPQTSTGNHAITFDLNGNAQTLTPRLNLHLAPQVSAFGGVRNDWTCLHKTPGQCDERRSSTYFSGVTFSSERCQLTGRIARGQTFFGALGLTGDRALIEKTDYVGGRLHCGRRVSLRGGWTLAPSLKVQLTHGRATSHNAGIVGLTGSRIGLDLSLRIARQGFYLGVTRASTRDRWSARFHEVTAQGESAFSELRAEIGLTGAEVQFKASLFRGDDDHGADLAMHVAF